jgi:multiple sugar transport system permease protein
MKTRSRPVTFFLYGTLIVTSLMLLLPLLSLILTSFKTFEEAIGVYRWFPKQFNFNNYREIFELENFNYWLYFRNTMFIFVMKAVGTILTCTLTAYALIRFNVKFKSLWFTIMLSVILLPGELLAIPMYQFYLGVGWFDTYYPLFTACFFATDVFMIFLFRQFFMSVPKELFEAAEVDGASEFKIYWRILMPLSRPAILTCLILYFTGTYNELYGPMLYLSSPSKWTMAQGIKSIEDVFNLGPRDYIVPWNLVSSATLLSLIPVMLLFFIAQKQFMESVARTGIKG